MKQWLETRQVLDAIGALSREGKRAALATVIRVRGSAYRHEGAKLVVGEDEAITGNVSGGCLEEDVREVARRVIASGVAERRSYCGGANEVAAWDLGVGCEGEVEILIEPVAGDHAEERGLVAAEEAFVIVTDVGAALAEAGDGTRAAVRRVIHGAAAADWVGVGASRLETRGGRELFIDVLVPPPRLLIVSAGDDARHLARLADAVGFRVVVADRRPGLLAPERFPPGTRIVETDAARLGERVVLDPESFAVVMTHHFADDTDYLRALLQSPVRYLGVLGPRQRTDRILGLLRSEGPVDESRIFGPVGLDIGTDGAEQVALAVVAEVLAVRSGRRPRSLRERSAPIHTSGG
ncbi:MAG: XdhC family protein [Gemmatimonadetes bacterium]|nr:XdhC family protein [Gemmatimonadota bacterium]